MNKYSGGGAGGGIPAEQLTPAFVEPVLDPVVSGPTKRLR